MKLRVLGAVLAVILGGVSLNAAYAGALPAKYEAGLKVLRDYKTDRPDEFIDFCEKEISRCNRLNRGLQERAISVCLRIQQID